MSESPKVIVIRKEIYDPSLERYVNEEVPTQTVQKAVKKTTASVNAIMASHFIGSGTCATGAGTVGVGSVGRIVNMTVITTTPTAFYMKDRKGTIGFLYMPTAGEKMIIADAYRPWKTVEGSFAVCALASLAAGTYTVDFEIVKRSQKV
jgi:hypothetical protein